jgi:uncharacterized membrane protein YfcA
VPEPAWLLIPALVLVTGSAALQSTTGFGYNILVVPLLALFIDPKIVIPTVILHNILLDAVVLISAREFVNLGRIRLMLLTGIVCAPLGVLIQGLVDTQPLRILIGTVVIATGLIMLAGYRRYISNERVAMSVAGSLGGTMNGLVGMAGPPVILLFANQGMPPREFRANIVTYFFLITLIATAAFWADGALTRDVFELTLVTIPATAVGLAVGIRLHGKVPLATFQRVSLLLVIGAGLTAIVAGLA